MERFKRRFYANILDSIYAVVCHCHFLWDIVSCSWTFFHRWWVGCIFLLHSYFTVAHTTPDRPYANQFYKLFKCPFNCGSSISGESLYSRCTPTLIKIFTLLALDQLLGHCRDHSQHISFNAHGYPIQ